jgi:hypothetical protein
VRTGTRDPAVGRMTETEDAILPPPPRSEVLPRIRNRHSVRSVARNPLRVTPRRRLPEHPHRRERVAALGVRRSDPRARSQPAFHSPHPHTPDSVTAAVWNSPQATACTRL